MTGWEFFLVLFAGLAATSGLQILGALIWGSFKGSATGRITRNESRLFARLFRASLVVFIVSTIFLMVVLYATFNPPGD